MKLTDPVPSTKVPRSVTRIFGLTCLGTGGLLLILTLVVVVRGELFWGTNPLNLLIGSCILIGFGIVIDRDRLKDDKDATNQALGIAPDEGEDKSPS